MLKYLKIFSIFLLFLSFSLTEVKAEQVLTWEDCIELTKKNHPDLISSKEKLNQAEFNKRITISAMFPQLSGSLSTRTSKAENSQQSESYSYSISGRQLLITSIFSVR
ncbi:MAG: TolC family protein [bacterium]